MSSNISINIDIYTDLVVVSLSNQEIYKIPINKKYKSYLIDNIQLWKIENTKLLNEKKVRLHYQSFRASYNYFNY